MGTLLIHHLTYLASRISRLTTLRPVCSQFAAFKLSKKMAEKVDYVKQRSAQSILLQRCIALTRKIQ